MPTLHWIGKEAILNHHREVPFRLLETERELSAGNLGSENLLVEGDNLVALKALLPYYSAKVKCIYIDPPYNTGNEKWVFNDNVNSPQIRKWLGQVVGKDASDLSRHDKWLCMMYPRLQLLKRFLREDGVLFVSINEKELGNLRLILDEIFGESNFITILVWEKGKKGDAKFFSVTHEYIFVYAKRKSKLVANNTKWRKKKRGVNRVLSKYKSLREQYRDDHAEIRKEMMRWYRELPKDDPARAHKHYNWSDDQGLYFAADFAGPDDGRENRPRYDILHLVTGKPCKKPSTGWRWEESRTKEALEADPPLIHFGPDETTIPCRKSYLTNISEEPFQSVFYKDGRAATLELEQMVGPGMIEFPKDSEVLSELIDLVCSDDDIILDSFAGSGTTGHAVLKLNHADSGNRKFILVEMEEDICRNVTRERLSKAIEGYEPLSQKSKENYVEGLGGGFRYCTMGKQLFDDYGRVEQSVSYPELASYVYYAETGMPIPDPGCSQKPLLGVYGNVAVIMLYSGNGTREGGRAILDKHSLPKLPAHGGQRVVYCESCRLSKTALDRENIVIRQIPYHLKVK